MASRTKLNPKGIDAVVFVDATPRWMYGHTLAARDEEYATDHDVLEMAYAHERISAVCSHVEEHLPDVPVLFLELAAYERGLYKLDKLTGTRVAFGGVYGGECVHDLAKQMHNDLNVRRLFLINAIVWPEDEPHEGAWIHEVFPGILAHFKHNELLTELLQLENA